MYDICIHAVSHLDLWLFFFSAKHRSHDLGRLAQRYPAMGRSGTMDLHLLRAFMFVAVLSHLRNFIVQTFPSDWKAREEQKEDAKTQESSRRERGLNGALQYCAFMIISYMYRRLCEKNSDILLKQCVSHSCTLCTTTFKITVFWNYSTQTSQFNCLLTAKNFIGYLSILRYFENALVRSSVTADDPNQEYTTWHKRRTF